MAGQEETETGAINKSRRTLAWQTYTGKSDFANKNKKKEEEEEEVVDLEDAPLTLNENEEEEEEQGGEEDEEDSKEKNEEGEEEEDDDFSEEWEEDDSVSSAAAREEAVREGFWGWLVDYVKGDIFGRFMDIVGPIIVGAFTCVWKVLQKVVKGNQEDDGDMPGAEDVAEEIMDNVGQSVGNFGQSSYGGMSGGAVQQVHGSRCGRCRIIPSCSRTRSRSRAASCHACFCPSR